MKKGKTIKKEAREETHYLKTIAKGAVIVLLGMFIGKIIGYIYVMFVARLGTEQFGLLNLSSTIAALFTTIALLGLDSGILRYVSYYLGKKDKAGIKGAIIPSLKISLPLSILLTIFLFIFSNEIATYFFHDIRLAPLLRIFAFIIPFNTTTTLFLSSFRAFQHVGYAIGITEILEKATRLLFAFLLISIGLGVVGASYSFLISAVVVFFVSLFILEKKVFSIFKTKIKTKSYIKELLHYSFPLMLSGILIFIITWTDTLMLGYFKTASQVGIYNAAHPTATLIFILPTALVYLFLPIISRLYSKKKINEIRDIFKRISKWIFVINFPIFLLIIFFSKDIIRIIFGQDYVAGTLALILLSIGYIMYSLSFPSSNILAMAKKTKLIFWITMVFAGSNIFFNYFLIPKYGINGAALATSVSYFIGALLLIFFAIRTMKISPIKKSFFKPFLAGILSIIPIYYMTTIIFDQLSFLTFLIIFPVFVSVYILLFVLFKGPEKQDMKILKIFIDKLKRNNNNHKNHKNHILPLNSKIN